MNYSPIGFGEYLFVGGFILLAILSIAAKIYNSFSHTYYKKEKLRPDAKIVDVKRMTVGGKNDKKICTTVTFDDGFEYVSHKTDRENHLMSYRIQVTEATKKEILEDAIAAHQKACGINPSTVPKSASVQAPITKTPPSPRTPAAAPRTQPVQKQTPRTLEEEFLDVYLQTRSKPVGGEEDAWNWVMGQSRSFKNRGLGREEMLELECNMITNLPNCYAKYFNDFLALAGDMTPIVIACERLLEKGNGPAAKAAADPYLKYLLAHPEKYNAGQVCCQGREEVALCLLSGHKLDGPRAEDNYTMFLVLYCRILDNVLCRTPEEILAKDREKERYLNIAAKMSPCNATVWEAFAKIYINSDEQKYKEYIQKALRYSYRTGEPYGLGAVYANLAMHYTTRDPQLAYALCELCRNYEGDPIAAEFVLSRKGTAKPKDPDTLLCNAEIQQGFSGLANAAIQMAQKQ